MSYTKADMRAIFIRGAKLGICLLNEGDPDAAAEEIAAGFFDQAMKALREAKPKGFNATKAIDEWKKAGKPKGWGVLEGLEEFFGKD